jgi:hypothetical protein
MERLFFPRISIPVLGFLLTHRQVALTVSAAILRQQMYLRHRGVGESARVMSMQTAGEPPSR